MRWPDIFFKAKTGKPSEAGNSGNSPDESAQVDDPVAESTETDAAPPTEFSPPEPSAAPVARIKFHPAPVAADKDVAREMNEADTLRQLTRSGGIRLVRRDFFVVAPRARAVLKPESQEIVPAPPPEPEIVPPAEAEAPPAAATTEEPVPENMAAPAVEPNGTTETPSAPPTRGAPVINLFGTREPGPLPAAATILRRRIKMADVARIVLPPRREETISLPAMAPLAAVPAPMEAPPEPITVVPASFPVTVEAGTVLQSEKAETVPSTPEAVAQPVEEKKAEEAPKPVESPVIDGSAKVEPPPPNMAGKKEFILSNGERIIGSVLSENSESIYLHHTTLGVLTIPRAQIAQRPVEIILINGDRIVGDIVAETPDSVFVRHASLGILTVPRNQQSTRVVEAILKDGDRILGEVLGETENFTVIRSATLGTVAVPHNRVALLNRRAEQMPMKSLPPYLENKSDTQN